MMRLVFAALFVVVSIFVVSALMDGADQMGTALPFGELLLGIVFLLLCVVAMVLFNRWGSDPLELRDPDEQVRRLEAQGLLDVRDFRATRAFEVEEYEDLGLNYFVELEDSGVLYLNGQYLYDYHPIEDDPEAYQPRRFPCTEFSVRRHREYGYPIDILCRGRVLEPEVVAPWFKTTGGDPRSLPEDGDIVYDRIYDDIKAERLRVRHKT